MKRLLMGNEAFAHASLEAGVGVFAGYPGTPSSELIETVAKLHAQGAADGIHIEWSTNEKAALEVAAGAAMSGVRALFTCKQVGLNVASDALMSLNYVGVRAGLVIFVADDPGPISSQTEQDTRRFAAFAKVPVLDPATPEQGFEMMKEAFELSERYGTPVIVRPTTRIDHASTYIDVAESTRAQLPDRGFERDSSRWVIFPRRSFQAHGEINERLRAISEEGAPEGPLARFNPVYCGAGASAQSAGDAQSDDAQAAGASEQAGAGARGAYGVVAGGDAAMYALEALSMLDAAASDAGISAPSWKLLQVGVPYPFPEKAAESFTCDVCGLLAFEELDFVLEEELLKVRGAMCVDAGHAGHFAPSVFGKLTGTVPGRGELSTEAALRSLASFFREMAASPAGCGAASGSCATDASAFAELADLAESLADPARLASFPNADELPPRPPVLCAGCPHRGSFYAVKQALAAMRIPRDQAVFCGDIGCYTLGNAAPLDAVDTCLCMGAGMTMAQGFSVASSLIDAASSEGGAAPSKAIAFIGDSTFFASGLTGVANAVYNGIDVTFCILDNSTTAMTGMQPHPGTGATLMGQMNEPISIEGSLRALGVKLIVQADSLDRASASKAAQEALGFAGPSAVIFKSPCVWAKPFAAALAVDPGKCIGCRKCITEIGCPAVGFDPKAQGTASGSRGQARIDASQCSGCGLCAQICPANAIAAPIVAEGEEQPC